MDYLPRRDAGTAGTNALEDIFEFLGTNQDTLGVKDFSVEITTLEEVFISVGAGLSDDDSHDDDDEESTTTEKRVPVGPRDRSLKNQVRAVFSMQFERDFVNKPFGTGFTAVILGAVFTWLITCSCDMVSPPEGSADDESYRLGARYLPGIDSGVALIVSTF